MKDELILDQVSFTQEISILHAIKNPSFRLNITHDGIVQAFIDSSISVQWHVYRVACVVDRIQKYYCSIVPRKDKAISVEPYRPLVQSSALASCMTSLYYGKLYLKSG